MQITRLLGIGSSRGTRRGRKSAGQSLVEFTIMLPLLAMMLSGLIEFGFMLNYYLDIIDAAREAARFAANDDPIRDDTTGAPLDPNPGFYDRGQDLTKQALSASSDDRINWPEFNPQPVNCASINGDVVLSAFAIVGDAVDTRFPVSAGENGVSMCGNYYSKLTSSDVNGTLGGATIPNTGFVLVEIYYEYNMILGLPWITAFVPDPVTLYAYSIMPNTNVEPTTTPFAGGPPPPPPPPPGPPPPPPPGPPPPPPGPPPPAPPPPGPPPPTNTPSPTPTPDCSMIYITNMWISGDNVLATVQNDNVATGYLTTTNFVWAELSGSMHVDWFKFGGTQYYGGNDYDSPTIVSGSNVPIGGGAGVTWDTDFDGEPFEPLTGAYTLTLTFDFPGMGTCVTSDSIGTGTPTATPAVTNTPTATPDCSQIYISSMWISGDNVRATVQNDNVAAGDLTTTNFVWPELSASMRVDWFKFGGTTYYTGDDYSSPTVVINSNQPIAGGAGVTWDTDFDGEPFEPLTGTYTLTLTFDFPGWGTCVASGSVTG